MLPVLLTNAKLHSGPHGVARFSQSSQGTEPESSFMKKPRLRGLPQGRSWACPSLVEETANGGEVRAHHTELGDAVEVRRGRAAQDARDVHLVQRFVKPSGLTSMCDRLVKRQQAIEALRPVWNASP